MERTVLYAEEGMILTNSKTFGKVIYLAENENADDYTQIPEEQYLQILENGVPSDEATEEDYQAALREFGVEV